MGMFLMCILWGGLFYLLVNFERIYKRIFGKFDKYLESLD